MSLHLTLHFSCLYWESKIYKNKIPYPFLLYIRALLEYLARVLPLFHYLYVKALFIMLPLLHQCSLKPDRTIKTM